MRTWLTFDVTIAVFAAALMGSAADGRADEAADAEQSLRQKRLEWLRSRADEFEIRSGDSNGPQFKRGEEPILRWNNPVREFVNDGVTYLFFDGGRPRAVVTVWVRSREKSLTSGEFWRELVSLSDQPLVCQRGGRTIWSPSTGGLVDQTLPDAEPPAEKPARRLSQIRDLANRFRAISYKDDGAPNELRLLPRPLFSYHAAAQGVLDGALFAFVEGNDAEALLLVKAVTAERGNGREWRYTLARMTSYRIVVRLDEQEVFVAEPYWKGPRKPDDPYSEAREGLFQLGEIAGEASGNKKE